MSVRLIQLIGPDGRRVGLVEDKQINLLHRFTSIWALAQEALNSGVPLQKSIQPTHEMLPYDSIYAGRGVWRILPAIDHPEEPARCMVSGTGLSHIRSAANRQAMHASGEQITDSMRMYEWGVEGGRPEPGAIGTAPEWFFKGTGSTLRGHNQPLDVPVYAEDGGEEPEVAGVYIVDPTGAPRRIGMAAGNEFSDHVVEKKNYLYLAASKLRTCSLGPELVLDPQFGLVTGEVSVERAGAVLWSKPIRTGEEVMCHSLANLEHHHFKFDAHRRPGDVHVHYFGADAFSFGEGIRLQNGDVMQVRWDGFGRPLRNPIRIARREEKLISVKGI
jgi:hypothetical protein